MKPVAALLWKECRELRWFLITGLIIFLILPLIGAIQHHWLRDYRLELETTPWVAAFAGVLAVFIAVGSSCRDLSDRLMVFWRSRPISIGQWLSIKYLSGLSLVVLLCTLPLLVEAWLSDARGRSIDGALILLAWHPFVVSAIYSMAFLIGCLVRRVTQAAMLSLAAMLLIYFMPYVLPPLDWLSLALMIETSERVRWDHSIASSVAYIGRLPWQVAYTPAHIYYVLGMLGISALSAVAAWLAVRKDWRVAADQKLMYWSIGLAGLMLVWAMAYQVGSNLPVQQEMAMPGENQVPRDIIASGNHAVLLTMPYWDQHTVNSELRVWRLWPLEITSSGVNVGQAVKFDRNEDGCLLENLVLHPTGKHAYVPAGQDYVQATASRLSDGDRSSWRPELWTVRLDGGGHVVHRLDLGRETMSGSSLRLYILENRLYMATASRLAAMDITNAEAPRLLWTRPYDPDLIGIRRSGRIQEGVIEIGLCALDGLSPRQRLEATASLVMYRQICLNDEFMYFYDQQALSVYRLARLDEKQARFELVGSTRHTAIELLLWQGWGGLTTCNGTLYGSRSSGKGSFGLTVYDTRDPRHVRRAGHFAAPSGYSPFATAPLPDGRVLVGGTKLYLLGRPRGN